MLKTNFLAQENSLLFPLYVKSLHASIINNEGVAAIKIKYVNCSQKAT